MLACEECRPQWVLPLMQSAVLHHKGQRAAGMELTEQLVAVGITLVGAYIVALLDVDVHVHVHVRARGRARGGRLVGHDAASGHMRRPDWAATSQLSSWARDMSLSLLIVASSPHDGG